MMQPQPTQEQVMSGQQQLGQQMGQQMAQQMNQQMMLCPVRVVYETQILVPPGEQYQPNQTIFINPQNPPPWANQNPQPAVVPQNQMVYVQQMPNNMQQQTIMDQNQQMYIQQAFPNMQPVIQNQNMAMMQQNQQERQILRQPIQTIQFQNVPPDINALNINYAQMINAQSLPNIVHNIPNMQHTQILGQGMQNMQVQMPQMIPQVQQRPQLQPNMQQQQQLQQQQQQLQLQRPQIQPNQQRPMNIQQTQLIRAPQQNIVNIQPNMVMQNVQNIVQNVNNQQLNKQQVGNIRPQNVQVRHNLPQQVMMPKQHLMQNVNQQQRNSPNTYMQQNQIRQMQPQPNAFQNQSIPTSNAITANINKNINNKVPISNNMSQINTQLRARVQNPQGVRGNIPQLRPMQGNYMQNPQQNIQSHSMGTQYVRPVQRFCPDVSKIMQNQQVNNQSNQPVNNQTNQQVNNQSHQQVNNQTNQQINDNVNRNVATDNRKRKSESPDETKAKITVNNSTQVSMPVMRNNSQFQGQMLKTGNTGSMQVTLSPMTKPAVGRDMPNISQYIKMEPSSGVYTNMTQSQNFNHQSSQNLNHQSSQNLNHQSSQNLNNQSSQNLSHQSSQNLSQVQNQNFTPSPHLVQSQNLGQHQDVNKSQDNQEKLIRNTVYAQAKSRKLSNSQSSTDSLNLDSKDLNQQANTVTISSTSIIPIAPNTVSMANPSHIPVNIANILSHSSNIQPLKPSLNLQSSNLQSNLQSSNLQLTTLQPSNLQSTTLQPSNLQSNLQPPNIKSSNIQPATISKVFQPPTTISNQVQIKTEATEITATKVNINETTDIKTFVIKKEADKVKVETADVKKEKLNIIDEKIKNINSICGKEIELSHGNKKSEKDNSFVLTHVLDGIVIQESNIAFPIRIPLKERSLLPNPLAVKDEGTKKEAPPAADLNNTKIGDYKILTISKLNIEEETDVDMEKIEDNPFSALKSQIVRSWSSEDLEKHLSNNWQETASILKEHEIDGEALFLVSPAQLLEIGINENHANILCEFVKS